MRRHFLNRMSLCTRKLQILPVYVVCVAPFLLTNVKNTSKKWIFLGANFRLVSGTKNYGQF